MSETAPTEIRLHKTSRNLEVQFGPTESYSLTCEFIRVYSPSAEVAGHSPSQAVLQTGKRDVAISAIEPVGNYGIQLTFDDGHDSGIYSWSYLKKLGENKQQLWRDYLERLEHAKKSR